MAAALGHLHLPGGMASISWLASPEPVFHLLPAPVEELLLKGVHSFE